MYLMVIHDVFKMQEWLKANESQARAKEIWNTLTTNRKMVVLNTFMFHPIFHPVLFDTKGCCPSVNFILAFSSITKEGQRRQISVDDSVHSVPETFVTLLILEPGCVHWSYPVQPWVLTFKQTNTSHTIISQKLSVSIKLELRRFFLKHLGEKKFRLKSSLRD